MNTMHLMQMLKPPAGHQSAKEKSCSRLLVFLLTDEEDVIKMILGITRVLKCVDANEGNFSSATFTPSERAPQHPPTHYYYYYYYYYYILYIIFNIIIIIILIIYYI